MSCENCHKAESRVKEQDAELKAMAVKCDEHCLEASDRVKALKAELAVHREHGHYRIDPDTNTGYWECDAAFAEIQQELSDARRTIADRDREIGELRGKNG